MTTSLCPSLIFYAPDRLWTKYNDDILLGSYAHSSPPMLRGTDPTQISLLKMVNKVPIYRWPMPPPPPKLRVHYIIEWPTVWLAAGMLSTYTVVRSC
jgi:hypothetical protein